MSKSKRIKKPEQEKEPVSLFIKNIINGPGGFKSYERHEIVIFQDREIGIAEFVIRCLANKRCEGSQEVLDAILKQREL